MSDQATCNQSCHGAPRATEANSRFLLAIVGFAASLLISASARAQVEPVLNSAFPFAVLGVNAVTCTDTGPGIGIFGQVGTTAAGITNTGCTITGPIVAPVPASVVSDFNNAFNSIDTQNPVCTGVIPIVSSTLPPGVYCSAAGTTMTGITITLLGNATDVWIFRVGTGGPGALTLTNANVIMGGGAVACHVFWKTSAATTLTDATFSGTVLSGAAVTMTRVAWTGRAMATTDVTLTDPLPMTFQGCAPGGTVGPVATPTLSEWAMAMLAALLAITGFAAMRRRAR